MSWGILPMTNSMAFNTFQVRGGAQGRASSSLTPLPAADLTTSCMAANLLLALLNAACGNTELFVVNLQHQELVVHTTGHATECGGWWERSVMI